MTNEIEGRAGGDRANVRLLLDRLKRHRLQREWTQREMAERSGMSRASYQNFEAGVSNITLVNFLRVLGALGFAQNLASLIPEPEEERTLQMLEAPRQRARRRQASHD
ncbi:MAG TPA: helix-turn-helix transcriptional regulator [Opitutaceae bacterium]